MKNFAAAGSADRYFMSGGLKLHYLEWGDPASDTLILVHGIRDQARSWEFFLSALLARASRSFHAVALDLHGHGESQWSGPDHGYRHEDFVLDLAGLVRHLRKDSLALIGHSLGGSMAILFAGCFPARVKKLVLIEAMGPYARAERDIPEMMARWLRVGADEAQNTSYPTVEEAGRAIQKRFPTVSDEAALHMARHGTRSSKNGLAWKYDPRLRIPSLSCLSESQIHAFIERIECPTLVVYGGAGEFMKSPRAQRMSLFKNSTIVGIPGSGHHVPHEKPVELAQVVYPFLFEG